MPSPFPGMDPYLEHRSHWAGVHTWLIAVIAELIGAQLPAAYYVAIEERSYVASASETASLGIADVLVAREPGAPRETNGHPAKPNGASPHVGVPAHPGAAVLLVELPSPPQLRQRYLEVRTTRGHEVVTVIEVLSPTNKQSGEGRLQYEAKRQATLESPASLVEIDLLRAGRPMPMRYGGREVRDDVAGDERVLVARSWQRPRADLVICSVREPLPVVAIPLRQDDDEPQLDLQQALRIVYERGQYARRLDYAGDPDPPLAPADAIWATQLLRERGLR